jgi:hypothetical protein
MTKSVTYLLLLFTNFLKKKYISARKFRRNENRYSRKSKKKLRWINQTSSVPDLPQENFPLGIRLMH